MRADIENPAIVMMHPDERSLLETELSKDKTMLEWGSGGSTLYFSNFVKEICSFEHTTEWYEKVSQQIKEHDIKNIDYNHVPSDLEFKKPQGHRRSDYKGTPAKYFRTYIDAVEKYGKSKFDVILVDGRARLYCAIKALPYLKDGGCLYMHDFFGRRQYHDVFDFYDTVSAVKYTPQTMVKLKKKPREGMPDPSFYDNIKTVEEIAEILERDPNNFEWK